MKEFTVDELRVFCLLFQNVPSKLMIMIGRAVDGAELSLNEYLFSDAHIVCTHSDCFNSAKMVQNMGCNEDSCYCMLCGCG